MAAVSTEEVAAFYRRAAIASGLFGVAAAILGIAGILMSLEGVTLISGFLISGSLALAIVAIIYGIDIVLAPLHEKDGDDDPWAPDPWAAVRPWPPGTQRPAALGCTLGFLIIAAAFLGVIIAASLNVWDYWF